ncbi:hypothetical protein Trco_007999 [Trichoderma cornu-damae]|uniref:Uncharacterized protein n=1 Tax=Trichoderma cornu-damae TaxID=654480 RepID=A0A9P8QF22_9HYPO|nr:hypothetical protein Trco_007999 [Trichoderma cornu-damae]
MNPPHTESAPSPVSPTSPRPRTATSSPPIKSLPPEIIANIMGSLTSRRDLGNFAASLPYFAAVLKASKISILKMMIKNMLHPSNLDICLLTMGILQVTRDGDDIWKCLYALAQRPTLDTIRDAETLCNMLDLTCFINDLLKIYTYPKYPDTFWRRALRKYSDRWPDGYVPDGDVSICPATRDRLHEVASRLWSVRDAALGNSPGSPPRAEHSSEVMALFQREMFCAELKLRCDMVVELGHNIPEWMFEEAPGDGVQSFLELLWCCSVHAMAKCWDRDDGDVWSEMNRSPWALGKSLGIRFYIGLATYMPIHADQKHIEEICQAIINFVTYYSFPDLYRDAYQWFPEFQEAAWEGLWNHTFDYCRLLDGGIVGELGGGTDYF